MVVDPTIVIPISKFHIRDWFAADPIRGLLLQNVVENLPYLLFALMCAYLICGRLASRRSEIRRAQFAGREKNDLDRMLENHFPVDQFRRDEVRRIWLDAATILKLSSEQLLPSDSFEEELAPLEGLVAISELDSLEGYYRSEWKRKGKQGPPERLSTIGELVRALAQD